LSQWIKNVKLETGYEYEEGEIIATKTGQYKYVHIVTLNPLVNFIIWKQLNVHSKITQTKSLQKSSRFRNMDCCGATVQD